MPFAPLLGFGLCEGVPETHVLRAAARTTRRSESGPAAKLTRLIGDIADHCLIVVIAVPLPPLGHAATLRAWRWTGEHDRPRTPTLVHAYALPQGRCVQVAALTSIVYGLTVKLPSAKMT